MREARFSCGLTVEGHEQIKADPARWASEVTRHRRDRMGLEHAEHSCGSTLSLVVDRAAYDAVVGGVA